MYSDHDQDESVVDDDPQVERPESGCQSQRVAQEADVLRRGALPAYLASVLPFDGVGADACQSYLDQILADAGDPADPLVRMAIEQLVLTHHRIAALQVSAANAKTAEASVAYTAAAAKLLAEHRRLTEAVQAQLSGAQPPKKRRFGTIG